MASTILSDNGVTSGSAGLKTTAASDGALALQTTTAGGAATTAVTIDTSQLVGIGTTTPSPYGGALVVRKANTGQGVTNATAQFSDAVNSTLWIGHTSGAANLVADQAIAFGYTNGTTTTERMRIDTSGRLLIGTTSASYGKLVISGASADVAMQIADTASTTAGIGFNGSGSTNGVGAPTGTLYFGQYNGFPMVFTNNNAERMRISSAGVVTAPYQPCFCAYRTTTQSGTSPFTILFDTVPVNVGSCYDSGTGRFTAPVTGNYHFAFQTLGIVTSWSSFDVFSYKNGGSTPSILSTRPTSTSGSDNASALSTSVAICNLTAGDYIEIKASSTTIYSDGNAWLKFMGFLIG